MIKKPLLFIALLFISHIINAQADFRKGYVVANSKDTLHGLIDYRGYIKNSAICRFKRNIKDSLMVFTPNDLIEYRISGEKYYVSRIVPTKEGEKRLFLEYLVKGQANIYCYREGVIDHFLIDKKGEPLKEIPYSEKEVMVNNSKRLWISTVHIGLLKTYLSDCPALFKQIESIKKPDYNNLIKLATEYHRLTSKNDSCIVYEKQKVSISIAFEPTIGFFRHRFFNDVNKEFGFLIHISLPLMSEKIFFKTGYMLSQPSINNEKYTTKKIPLQLEYLTPGKNIHFRFSFGGNVTSGSFERKIKSDIKFYTALGTGGLLKVTKRVFISSNFNLEFIPVYANLVYEKRIRWISYSTDIGLYIKF